MIAINRKIWCGCTTAWSLLVIKICLKVMKKVVPHYLHHNYNNKNSINNLLKGH